MLKIILVLVHCTISKFKKIICLMRRFYWINLKYYILQDHDYFKRDGLTRLGRAAIGFIG
jgi:hypothetical protein